MKPRTPKHTLVSAFLESNPAPVRTIQLADLVTRHRDPSASAVFHVKLVTVFL
jgi:hypothetical protein